MVVGHEAEQLVAHLSRRWPEVETVMNERFRLGNGVSVACARERMPDNFILAMADHVVSDRIWELAVSSEPARGGVTLLVDRRIDQVFDLDDATKARVGAEGRLLEIGKELAEYNAIDTGVFVCSPSIFRGIEAQMVASGDASLSDGIMMMIERDAAGALDIGDAFWQDVDTPEMLAHAESWLADLATLP